MPREIPPAIRQKTLDILRERFKPADVDIDSAVYLSEPARRNILMRITLTSTSDSFPKSVILKQVLAQAADADDKRAEARFARDWAGLEFTSSIQEESSVHNTPLFYGSDARQRFILIEDLGQPHVSLVDSLTRPDRDRAVSALGRYMKALGSFHATTFGHMDSYISILKKINREATTPEADLASTSEHLLPALDSAIKSLVLRMPEDFPHEVRQVLNSTFKPGAFTVLTHGDIAPDNVFDHEGPQGLQLIDFEWCAPRNALLDGTFLRMSIPTGWCAKTIPDDVLKPLERIYRTELAKKVPEASDDLAYSTAYTHACAFHMLHQMASLDSILEKDEIWGSGPMPEGLLWDPATNSIRSRFLSRLQAFVDVATEHNRLHPDQPPILPNLRKMAEDMLAKVKTLWSEDTKPLDFFPAFKPASPQLAQALHVDEAAGMSATGSDGSPKITTQYKDKTQEIRQADPEHTGSTELSPFQTTPKPS